VVLTSIKLSVDSGNGRMKTTNKLTNTAMGCEFEPCIPRNAYATSNVPVAILL
jgi:hypothetical protein